MSELVTVALERSQLMLRAAEELVDTVSLAEVRKKVRNLVSGDLKPAYVGLVLIDGQHLRRIPDPESTFVTETRTPVFPLDSPMPSARAARDGEIVVVGDRGALEAEYGQLATAEYVAAGLRSAVYVPLPGTRRTLGALILGWMTPHQADVTERAVLTAVAGYTARAVERALHLEERITVARQLQQAMLTDLPAFPGLELAAFYQPAAIGELVGGDWYDAYPLADRSPGPVPVRSAVPLAITVGDITGHDMHAAAIMGQVRSMLRQADLHDDLDPARAVAAVEQTCERLSLAATGTLVHGHLRPVGDVTSWRLTWTNAGHPPLLLRHRDGQTEQLGEHDSLLWPSLPGNRRTDHQRILVPGDTLLLYTDGLVERHADGMDAAITRVAALLSAASAGQSLPDLLSQLTGTAAETASDDIALLAVRFPAG